jgi:hypothetical protein
LKEDDIYKHLKIFEKEGSKGHLEGKRENLGTFEKKRKNKENI